MKGQTIIEYYSGQPTFVLFISPERVLFQKIENDSLVKYIESYRFCLSQIKVNEIKKTEAEFSKSAYALYQLLLKPFEPFLENQKEIIIIPDKDLNSIPFEALTTYTQWKGYRNAPYLIKKNYTISYAPSWKIYVHSLNQQPKTFSKVVSFSYGEGQSDLTCSQKEINAIHANFNKNQRTSLQYNQCLKDNFMNEWQNGDYDILHLSLHAKGSLKNIFDNKIWFSSDKKDFLYGFDLSGKTSKIPLIVLSACETGLGDATSGEGVYSISRYFFQAGAKTVLASLWQIDDCQSATIFESFYRNIKNGQKAKQALCEAKRLFVNDIKGDELTYYPSFWSGIICLE